MVYQDGLYWYEYDNSGTTARMLLTVSNSGLHKMADPLSAAAWTEITGTASFTPSNHADFETFRGKCFGTNGVNSPWQLDGSGNARPIPALQSGTYTFGVSGITVAPAEGDTYTNNAITFTITYCQLAGTAGAIGGYIVATAVSAPETSGVLTRATGSGDASITFTQSNANVNISTAKYICQYNNYLFLANVKLGDGTYHPTRMYWCDLANPNSWLGTSWIEVSMLDGQEITRLWGFSNYLFVFKTRSIYGCTFTGDADFPFILPGGGRSSSAVGCVAPWSVAQIEQGLVFLSYDGVYLFDGSTSYKLTDRIRDTVLAYKNSFSKVVSTVNRKKNMVYMAFATSSTNDNVLVWNYFLNSWSKYDGIAASAMVTAYLSGTDEAPLFSDYDGYTYRLDTGVDDYPLNVKTAIDAYFYTNWKTFDDLINKKGVPEVTIYCLQDNSNLTFSYSYDFSYADQYQNTFNTGDAGAMRWGEGVWGTAVWGGSGGGIVVRRDLTGRGRVIRFKVANGILGQGFRIDGFGFAAQLDTNV